jgi:hypothetical protein
MIVKVIIPCKAFEAKNHKNPVKCPLENIKKRYVRIFFVSFLTGVCPVDYKGSFTRIVMDSIMKKHVCMYMTMEYHSAILRIE